jgi:integrase
LWLGARTHQPIGPHGLRVTLAARAQKAGITGFHPHVMRHTAAARWLATAGSEGGLLSVARWSSRDMLDRYGRATASQRAADEARALNLGDLQDRKISGQSLELPEKPCTFEPGSTKRRQISVLS